MIALRRGLALTAALLLVTACGDDDATPKALSGYELLPAPSVAAIAVPDASDADASFPMMADEGQLLVVYFGYTSCPDVCPTTMSDLKRALAQLPPEDAERVEVVMVMIDPDRDVDDKLGAYVTTFIEDGDAARITDPAALRAAADAFGADYSVETAADGEIEVSHTADLYAVDDQGDIVLQWPFGTSYEDLSDDIADLLAEQPAT